MPKKSLFTIAIAAMIALCSFGCKSTAGSKTRFDTLMLTGNFLDSRLLCELAQYRTRQPMIVFSADADGTHQIYYAPANKKVIRLMSEDEFAEMVDFINPARIVVVGDKNIVPEQYPARIAEKYPVITICSDNWDMNAKSLGSLLNQNSLPKMFRSYRANIPQTQPQK